MAPSQVLRNLLYKMNLLYLFVPITLWFSFLKKEFKNGGKNQAEDLFGFPLYSARMVVECALGRLKARFSCLRTEMDINLKELPNIINSCFVLNNFCEERKGPINGKRVEAVIHYEKEFQPPIDGGYKASNNKSGGKSIRQVYVKYFE